MSSAPQEPIGGTPLRVAIVGTGNIANHAHIPAWRSRPDVKVVWAIDVRADTAHATADRWDIPRWGTDVRAALEDSDVDAVDFCTPPLERVAQVVPALEAGKHVLVEKPAAVTLAEAEAITSAAARARRVLLVAENWPYASATRRVRALLARGELGTLFLLHGSVESGQWLRPPPSASYAAHLGYTFLVGTHALNLARLLMGEVGQVAAYATPAAIPTGAHLIHETDMVVSVRFRNDGIGAFHFSSRAHFTNPRRSTFRLLGQEGSLEFDVHAGYVDWTVRGTRTRIDDPRPSMGYAEEIEHFVRCVRGEEQPGTSMVDYRETLRVILAVYQSAMTGRAVSI
ncbi:MAG: Gfo/Idh/MocA family oxidoreductase [Armatimonadota bacterium]|nr:Gfo/Idh/MocA family oxidoreductase [Armatimonadota bacterium]